MCKRTRFLVALPALSLLLAAIGYTHAFQTEQLVASVREIYNGSLSLGVQVETFRHIDQVFPSRVVAHGPSPFPLPKSSVSLANMSFVSRGSVYTLNQYLLLNRVTGLLIIKDGKIAHEKYRFGNTDRT